MSKPNITQASVIEDVVIRGDLSKLSPEEKTVYYKAVCDAVGVNPATRPFEYLTLKGKMILYARRECTEQLRKLDNISITIVGREKVGDVYVVTARATLPNGRTDESTGVVSVLGLKGDDLANGLMKAETKAKRRVTLSICGMGILDETELDTIDVGEIKHVQAKQIEHKPTPDVTAKETQPTPAANNGHLERPDDGNMAEEDFIDVPMADYLLEQAKPYKFTPEAICKRFGVGDLLQMTVKDYRFMLQGLAGMAKKGGAK